MKRLGTLALAAVFAASSVGAGLAADSNTLTVSANVVGTCKFNSATSTLAFGALDPASAGNATASGSTTFWCTKGASFSMSDDDGLYETGLNANRMKHLTLAEYIPYSVSFTPSAATGSGPTTPITLTLGGTILNADFVNASAGDYEDTVVISITP